MTSFSPKMYRRIRGDALGCSPPPRADKTRKSGINFAASAAFASESRCQLSYSTLRAPRPLTLERTSRIRGGPLCRFFKPLLRSSNKWPTSECRLCHRWHSSKKRQIGDRFSHQRGHVNGRKITEKAKKFVSPARLRR